MTEYGTVDYFDMYGERKSWTNFTVGPAQVTLQKNINN